MEPFKTFTGVVAPLDRADVDTDQIIPSDFLKRIERTGYEDYCFYPWRYDANGKPVPDFVLNDPRYQQATILVARENFGIGSSREHAVWALQQYGFKTIIAPSFSDIFYNNAMMNGLLLVRAPSETVRRILDLAKDGEGFSLTVDLENQTVSDAQGLGIQFQFEIDPFRKYCILNGLDDIGLTLQHEAAIAAYEAKRPSWLPTIRRDD